MGFAKAGSRSPGQARTTIAGRLNYNSDVVYIS